MTPEARIVRRHDLPSAVLGPTTRAVMNASRDYYFAMRGVSAAIWDLLAEEITVEDLCTKLCDTYEVDRARCLKDTVSLLEELEREGLVEIKGARDVQKR